jgi:predicted ATPase
MTIQRLEISGFRSLESVVWQPGALNVLIGPNGAGKSNLLRALVLLKRAAEGKLSDTVRDWDGMTALLWDGQAKELRFSLRTDPVGEKDRQVQDALTYDLTLAPVGRTSAFRVAYERLVHRFRQSEKRVSPDAPTLLLRDHGRATMFNSEHRKLESGSELYAEDETLLAQVSDPASYPINTAFRRSLADYQIYHDVRVDIDAEMRRAALLRRETRVEPNGSNLVGVLYTLYTTDRNFKTELNNAMQAAFGPDFEELVFPPAEDNRIQLRVRWRSLERGQSARDLSDGTLRFLFLITVLGATDLPPVLAIDEPETGLHPGMLPIVAEFAAEAAQRTQVILTTHSPQFLNAFKNQADIATLVDWKDGKTILRRPEPADLARWLEHYQLGDLWLSGELENHT